MKNERSGKKAAQKLSEDNSRSGSAAPRGPFTDEQIEMIKTQLQRMTVDAQGNLQANWEDWCRDEPGRVAQAIVLSMWRMK
jgi:hypothetical protein